MAVQSKQVTMSTTVQQLVSKDNVRQDVWLHAKQKCFIGGSAGVNTSNGFLVDNGDEFRITLFEGDELWGLTDAETGLVHLLISAQS